MMIIGGKREEERKRRKRKTTREFTGRCDWLRWRSTLARTAPTTARGSGRVVIVVAKAGGALHEGKARQGARNCQT